METIKIMIHSHIYSPTHYNAILIALNTTPAILQSLLQVLVLAIIVLQIFQQTSMCINVDAL